MSTSKIALSLIASAYATMTLSAMEFQVLGAKAASMGGAGIATSPSSLAAYNNPALLANNPEKFSLHVGVGAGFKDTGAGKAASDLNKLDFSNIMDAVQGNAENYTPSNADIITLGKARDIAIGMNAKGFEATPTANLALSFGSFGTGVFGSANIGARANIDQTHTDLIFETSAGQYIDVLTGNSKTLAQYNATSMQAAIEQGLTNLDVLGLAVAEIPLAYGYSFDTGYGPLSVGGAGKIMVGKTFSKTAKLDADNSFDNLDNNVQDTTTFGIDLGLAYKPTFAEGLTLALVGKNINTPSFDVSALAGGGSYDIKPAIRTGAAYKLNNWVALAMDADITENKSITGYNTRYVGGGANLDLSVLELNLGLMKNTSANDLAGLIYTAGIATGPTWLHFELSAQMASKSGEVDGTAYPMQAMVNFAISSAW